MKVYGGTCPMCCGDLDDVAYLKTGAAVCLFCRHNAEASASTPSTARRPDAIALSVSAITMRDPPRHKHGPVGYRRRMASRFRQAQAQRAAVGAIAL